MSFSAEALYRLLPAVHRIRDAELAAGMPDLLTATESNALKALEAIPNPTTKQQVRREVLREKAARGPLKALCYVFAEQIGVFEENLGQLYDDLFIETCADWVIPYVGDLIGYQPLHPLGKARSLARAEVAHTIALRRRKGTAAVLEQLARDVTGWNARAVEFFQLLATTQHMNHVRLGNHYAPAVRNWEPLSRIDHAFDNVAHTVDIRRIESGHGKFNIPNVGIFLWRLNNYSQTRSPAVRLDDRRWFISPLGHPLQLFHRRNAEEEITHIAEPVNVPEPISRRMLDAYRKLYYGTRPSPADPIDNIDPSIVLSVDGVEVPRTQIVSCDLSDDGTNWLHAPMSSRIAIDPVLGRIALAADLPVPQRVEVTFQRGFSADLGGGEYNREQVAELVNPVYVPKDHATLQDALNALAGSGTIIIKGSGRYEEAFSVTVLAGKRIVLRADDGSFPTLVLPMAGKLTIQGGTDSEFVLDGIMLTAARGALPPGSGPMPLLHVPTASGPVRLFIAHSTLVPGRTLDVAGNAQFPEALAVRVDAPGVAVRIERAIVGAIRLHETGALAASDSIIDATSVNRMALTGLDGSGPGGKLSLDACTVIGKLYVNEIAVISNSLLFARRAAADTDVPVRAERRQVGCVRFSYLPLDFASAHPSPLSARCRGRRVYRTGIHDIALWYRLLRSARSVHTGRDSTRR